MTTVRVSTHTVHEHRFTVPVNYATGATISEIYVACAMAEDTAKSLGLDTATDDWAHVTVTDDAVVFTVVENVIENT